MGQQCVSHIKSNAPYAMHLASISSMSDVFKDVRFVVAAISMSCIYFEYVIQIYTSLASSSVVQETFRANTTRNEPACDYITTHKRTMA